MSKNADDSGKIRWWPFWLILSFAVIFWFALVIEWFPGWIDESKRGVFGDSFGVVNALFSGLAFAGVIFAILLQKKELELQRVAIKGEKEAFQKQNFESSFFQLLTMHSEIVNSIVIRKGIDGEYFGRKCFGYMLKEFKSIYVSDMRNDGLSGVVLEGALKGARKGELDVTEELRQLIDEKVRKKYEKFFAEYQPYVGPYFRHLYQAVKFVDQSDFLKEFEAKKFYTNLIRAQLSSDELGLLFYNCLSDRGAKFKCLVEKYALFKDMSFEVLMNEEHQNLYAPSAYGESK